MRAGRKIKTHTASYDSNLHVPGLSRQGKRWRVVANGKEIRFTEPDEQRAINRALALLDIGKPATIERIETTVKPIERAGRTLTGLLAGMVQVAEAIGVKGASIPSVEQAGGEVVIGYNLDPTIVWPWVAAHFARDPDYVARMIGAPHGSLRNLSVPTSSLKLSVIIDAYEQHNKSKSNGRRVTVFKNMASQIGAKTLDDLTQDRLFKWRETIEKSGTIKSAGTKIWMYGVPKSILAFALKVPSMDAAQINAALARCKVLWTSDTPPAPAPTPISREHFHKLLAGKNGNMAWRPWLLVGLNLCLHMDEVCDLKWNDLDLEAGTHACIRNKTKADRIPRAAVLWPETIAALKSLPKKGPIYVFTSKYGTRYNRNTRGNKFAIMRKEMGVPDSVTFDCVRDGAYTAAINDKTVEERFARVLAGHRSPGLQDAYVLRNPACTADACLAVYRAYGPFPD